MQRELILRPGMFRAGALIAGGAALAAFGIAMWVVGGGWPRVYLGLAVPFLALGAYMRMSPRMWLHLSPTGFAYGTLLRRHAYHWSDVAAFGVSRFASLDHVVFVFAPDYAGEERVRRINQDFGAFDRFLPDTYGQRPEALAELLDSWRQSHAAARMRPAEAHSEQVRAM